MMTLLAANDARAGPDRATIHAAARQFELQRLDGVSVLVVDDERDARRLMKRFLEGRGAAVMTAGSVKEAMALLSSEPPDVILSDIGMPGNDGYELIHRVRKLPPEKGGDTPAAAVTAFARPEDRTRALDSGFQMHLAKPVDPAELLAAIADLADRGDN